MVGHDEENGGSDECEFNDEWIEVGTALGQDVVPEEVVAVLFALVFHLFHDFHALKQEIAFPIRIFSLELS